MLNGLDLFSGIGGLTIALEPWVRPVAYCELDRYCQAVLLSRMRDGDIPNAPIWDDVRTLEAEQLPEQVDIIYGGFPCQDVSVAGARAGLEGERSGLFFEIVRLARRLRPRFLFLENTPGIISLGLERVLSEITALGFDSRWSVVSAAQVGAPHLRERWWLYSYANGEGLQKPRGFANAKSKHRTKAGHPAVAMVQADVWGQPASVVCGMDDGIRPKTHRLRQLGNAVVPKQARVAFEMLSGVTP